MEPTVNQEEITQNPGLSSELERTEGTPSWDQTESPEEIDSEETSTGYEESPENLNGEEEVIWDDEDDQPGEDPEEDPEEDESEEEIETDNDEEEQNTPQDDSPRRVLGFSDYFNRAQ